MMRKVALKGVPVGKTFKVWGKKFTVLRQDEGKVFVLAAEFATTMQFREEGKEYKVAPNDFRDSSVKEYLNGEYIDELVAAGAGRNEDIFPLTVDLKCTMGQHEYGTDTVNAGLLTLEQYGEFYDIIPLIDDDWWCLATPWKTPSRSPSTYNTYYVWYVLTGGGCNLSSYSLSYGVRPALNLNPFLSVSYEDDGVFGDDESWDGYIKYLHKWAVEHDDKKFAGCAPATYQEWQGCEYEEGEQEKEVYDVEEALDYIGLGGNENAVQNS